MPTIAFTCGDINGIGPEIVIKSFNRIKLSGKTKIIFICPQNVFENTLKIIPANFSYKITKYITPHKLTQPITVLDIGNVKQSYGRNTIVSGKISYRSVIESLKLSEKKLVDAVVTAPISKTAWQKAGVKFPGHTELFAEKNHKDKFAMMFVSNIMKSALITIHEPIKKIPKLITKIKLENIINVVQKSMKTDFGISEPKIAILGLNPHAGENGKIGIEEEKVIIPVIKKYKNLVFGPMVPDAYFGNKIYEQFDCTIGMYHDQVLIPFKLLNFDKGVNFTAGLSIIRTSPDHGTAFDIAGKGIANEKSILTAYKYALKIFKNRSKNID